MDNRIYQKDPSELFASFYCQSSHVKITLLFCSPPSSCCFAFSVMVSTCAEEPACLFFTCIRYLVLCNQLCQNLRLKTTTIYFTHDFAGQQFGLVSGGQLFLSRTHHSYICCQLEGNSWGWLVYDVLSGKAGIDEASLMCYSPAGLSGLVHRASELHRQPDGKLNAQAIFKAVLPHVCYCHFRQSKL